jgi:hypothetical protein
LAFLPGMRQRDYQSLSLLLNEENRCINAGQHAQCSNGAQQSAPPFHAVTGLDCLRMKKIARYFPHY